MGHSPEFVNVTLYCVEEQWSRNHLVHLFNGKKQTCKNSKSGHRLSKLRKTKAK